VKLKNLACLFHLIFLDWKMCTNVQFLISFLGLIITSNVQAIQCEDTTCHVFGNVTTCLGVKNADVIATNLTTAMDLCNRKG
jgi:hypothetical protein